MNYSKIAFNMASELNKRVGHLEKNSKNTLQTLSHFDNFNLNLQQGKITSKVDFFMPTESSIYVELDVKGVSTGNYQLTICLEVNDIVFDTRNINILSGNFEQELKFNLHDEKAGKYKIAYSIYCDILNDVKIESATISLFAKGISEIKKGDNFRAIWQDDLKFFAKLQGTTVYVKDQNFNTTMLVEGVKAFDFASKKLLDENGTSLTPMQFHLLFLTIDEKDNLFLQIYDHMTQKLICKKLIDRNVSACAITSSGNCVTGKIAYIKSGALFFVDVLGNGKNTFLACPIKTQYKFYSVNSMEFSKDGANRISLILCTEKNSFILIDKNELCKNSESCLSLKVAKIQ